MPYLPIDSGFYQSSARPVASQKLTNWYVDAAETETITRAQIFPTPGLTEILNTGEQQVNRGGIVVAGKPYFVNGTFLYRVDMTISMAGDEVLSYHLIGSIPGTERVSLATNGDQICIVNPGSSAFVYTISTDTLTTITSAAFLSLGPSVKVVYLDGYFIHVSADGRTVFNSALNDALTYSALDFAEAESDPDDVLSCYAFGGKLFLLGETTTEVWQNTGSLGFPFQRVYVIPVGCIAKESLANFDTTFAFLGQDVGGQSAVYAFDGNGFNRISHGAIDNEFSQEQPDTLRNAFAFSYSQNGAIFYVLSYRTGTFVYDARTSRILQRSVWHQRSSIGLDNKSRWRVNCVLQAYGRYLVGDSESGIIGVIDGESYNEYGVIVSRELVCGPFRDSLGPIFWEKLELVVNSGQTYGEEIRMSYSDDGGYTWSYEQPRSLGSIGEYSQQITWYRLGRSLGSRMFKFEYSGDGRCVLIGLIGSFRGGRQ